MLLSELSTRASGLSEAAFIAAFPHPALVFRAHGAAIADSDDETLHGEGLWARTAPGASPVARAREASKGAAAVGQAAAPVVTFELGAPPPSGSPLLAFLKKSRRNPFGGLVVLGRQPRADVVVTASAVSKVHLIFAGDPDGWTVLDQQSANGTTLNRVPLAHGCPTRLHDGDVLVLGGSVEATFCQPRTVFCLADNWRRGDSLGAHGWVRVGSPADGSRLDRPR